MERLTYGPLMIKHRLPFNHLGPRTLRTKQVSLARMKAFECELNMAFFEWGLDLGQLERLGLLFLSGRVPSNKVSYFLIQYLFSSSQS